MIGDAPRAIGQPGHGDAEAGRRLPLAAIAQRLLTIRQGIESVARLGSDEFGLVLARDMSETAVSFIARRTKKILEKPFHIHGFKMSITVSIGVSSFPKDGDDIEALMNSARHAARIARDRGGSTIEYCNSTAAVICLSTARCAFQFKNALQPGKFELN